MYLSEACAFLSLSACLWESTLTARQWMALKRAEKDEKCEARNRMGKDDFQASILYGKDKCWLGFLTIASETIVSIYTILGGALPWMWETTDAWCGRWMSCDENGYLEEAIRSISFAMGWILISQALDIPIKLYSTFVVEARHGFNATTPRVFLKDTIVSALVACLAAPPLVAGAVFILRIAGPYVALYLWTFLLLFSLLVTVVYPTLIMPLFNRFDPLPDGKLKSKIEGLAGALGFPLRKLYVMDGSKRSGHSNAFMYGFFKNKRIVLFDTLMEQCEEDEVVGVLAHELGHWKLRHTMVLFVSAMTVLLVQLSAFTFIRNSEELYEAFGFKTRPVFISLVLFQLLVVPVDMLITLAQHGVSRLFEFQADAFAIGLGHGKPLRSALLKLEKENKASPVVDPWFSAYHYTHPPLSERLQAIDARLKREE